MCPGIKEKKQQLVVTGWEGLHILASLSIYILFSLPAGFVDVLAAAGSGSEV